MKILLVSSSSGSRGGGELYLLYLGRALVARGHQLTLWASDHERMDELCTQFAEFGRVTRTFYRNTYDRSARSLSTSVNFLESRRLARSWRGYDLIHLNKQNLEDGLDLLRALDQQPRPALCTIHLTQSARFLKASTAWLRDWVAWRALKRCHRPLVAISENRRRDLARFLGQTRGLHCIANGVPLLQPSLSAAADGTLHVVAVGRLMPQKRPLLFLEIAQRIHRSIPQARFTWIGDCALPGARFTSVDDDAMVTEWERKIVELGLTGIVTRTGWRNDVATFLPTADVFLHTAEYEGLPLALLEAMSAALPCVVTSGLVKDLGFLRPDANCLMVAEDDQWLERLHQLTERQRLGAAARDLVATQFSHERMATDYEDLYRKLLSSSRKTEP